MKISKSILKPRLRELGIEKWPSRRRKSLRRLLETAQTNTVGTLHSCNCVPAVRPTPQFWLTTTKHGFFHCKLLTGQLT